MKVFLSTPQISALQCRCDEPGVIVDAPTLTACWDTGSWLVFEAAQAPAILDELADAANSEDALMENSTDKETRQWARRAADSLSAISDKVLRAIR